LVVIAIIALLAASLFPVFARAREHAREGVEGQPVTRTAAWQEDTSDEE